MEYKKILIVDDSRAARFSLRKTLEKLNLDVDAVESGDNALSYLRECAEDLPDIIFMDNLMPGLNGFNTSKAIAEQPAWQHIPIIMCSATEGPDSLAKAKQHGITAILPKPATPEDVRHLLANLTASHQDTVLSKGNNMGDVNLAVEFLNAQATDTEVGLNKFAVSLQKAVDRHLQQFETRLSEIVGKAHPTDQSSLTAYSELQMQLNDLESRIIQQCTEQIKLELDQHAQKNPMPVETAKDNHQQLLDQVKSTAQFVATHHSIATAERIAKETTQQLLQGELILLMESFKQKWEQQMAKQVASWQKQHKHSQYFTIGISLLVGIIAVFISRF